MNPAHTKIACCSYFIRVERAKKSKIKQKWSHSNLPKLFFLRKTLNKTNILKCLEMY